VAGAGAEPIAGFNSGGGDGNCGELIVFMFVGEGGLRESHLAGELARRFTTGENSGGQAGPLNYAMILSVLLVMSFETSMTPTLAS
jgi:hypothetical protein